ncbi:MAG: tRNA pseudouridine(38-40) synthase TruA [Gammaproteobacteria bacterium]|nr:tRNA pseudouridine(38-40) synthase TruA [Gammaproteobacteria bacterium]
MRYVLAIEYDGSGYCGWQHQKHCKSVQSVVEQALSDVASESINLTCAGRTDSGVHAVAQFAHFDTNAVRPDRAWILGTNSQLEKESASVHWVASVGDDFHARYSALSRRYRYIVLNRLAKPGLQKGRVCCVHQPLDEVAMNQAAKYLIGEHDFSAFRAAGCQARHAVREIISLTVYRRHDRVYLDICANAFLHNMVRIIVGNLLQVGKGLEKPEWIREVLLGRDRTRGGVTAVPDGLYFLGAQYPSEFAIPDFSRDWRN